MLRDDVVKYPCPRRDLTMSGFWRQQRSTIAVHHLREREGETQHLTIEEFEEYRLARIIFKFIFPFNRELNEHIPGDEKYIK